MLVFPHHYMEATQPESDLYHISPHECTCSCVLHMTKKNYVLVIIILMHSINKIDYLRLNIFYTLQQKCYFLFGWVFFNSFEITCISLFLEICIILIETLCSFFLVNSRYFWLPHLLNQLDHLLFCCDSFYKHKSKTISFFWRA